MFKSENDSILAMPRAVLGLWLLGFMVVATVLTAWWAPETWGTVRIVVAGVLAGALSFCMLFVNRLLVS